MLLENFTYNARSGLSLQDIMIVDKSGKYIQTDITDLVAKSIGSAPQITFMILATNKDGGVAQFNSKENPQNKPYIKVQTAGGPVTIYPSDDSYISMGENSQANYASSLYLLAEESAVNEPQPVNGNTKRIYLKFDISQFGGAGGISSATFNIYGKNIGANEEKKVVLFSSFDNAWKESTITAANATSQVIFSYDQETSWRWEQPSGAGYRYEEELFRFDTWYDKLVKAYNSTSDGK